MQVNHFLLENDDIGKNSRKDIQTIPKRIDKITKECL